MIDREILSSLECLQFGQQLTEVFLYRTCSASFIYGCMWTVALLTAPLNSVFIDVLRLSSSEPPPPPPSSFFITTVSVFGATVSRLGPPGFE
uniref:Uncharacterized protein n=1 Tax=Pristionchus pacificus TaxID=54126 RepID=A0A2A6BVQ0_PRIPA|eukprot:PDM69989.1 hypothetical protein PRIPAC_49201 [Pristionchus pacificus]